MDFIAIAIQARISMEWLFGFVVGIIILSFFGKYLSAKLRK